MTAPHDELSCMTPPALAALLPASSPDRSADLALVARARGGEALAFEQLMRRHNRLLFRCARGLVDDDAEAQDVVQEAYLKAFLSLEGFRGDCALGTWLARITLHVALDGQRRRRRGPPLASTTQLAAHSRSAGANHDHDTDAGEASLMEHVMVAFHAPADSGPDAQLERRQMRRLLQRAIDSLPPLYRSVFILRAVQEMSVEDTAACLALNEAVVKTRYVRARALLRDALGAQVEAQVQEVYAFAGARCDAVVTQVLGELQRLGRLQPPG